ncbi:MAG: O-antigen ligase family protein [Desulfobulbaceae bacterium]|nr:O-antigen ligase family protein [Desulfobulbaceae bacterium]
MNCSTECNINKDRDPDQAPSFCKKSTAWLGKAGLYAVIGGCFSTALSTSVMGGFGFLIVLLWILSGRIKQLPELVKQNGPAAFAMLLGLLLLIAMFYSPASLDDALDGLKKYRELFFIPAVMSLLVTCNNRERQWAVSAFFIGCIISLIASYAMFLGFVPVPHYGYSLTYHITHSFFMAVLAFWTLHQVADNKKYRLPYIVLLLAVIGNIVYVTPGRTGMLTLVLLCVLFLGQRFSRKQFFIGFGVFLLVVLAAVISSKNVQNRVQDAYSDITTYEQGSSRSSLGQRFDWWYNCVRLIGQKPILGHGTGSFVLEHEKLIAGTGTKPTDNPHNEYLFLLVQTGGVGLLLFIALLVTAWRWGNKLLPNDKWLLQGVVLSMAAGCLMNSFLFDSHQGHYFAFLVGILAAPSPENF